MGLPEALRSIHISVSSTLAMLNPLRSLTLRQSAGGRFGAVLSAWLRDPLLHFIVLGAVVFSVDHFVAVRDNDSQTIVVTNEVDATVKQLFAASRGREPNTEELKALRERWLDNEVLYREGLALQVDKGDLAIRERVIFKALTVVDSNTKLPAFDDQILREWFERNRSKYDEPARYDFHEAVLSGEAPEAGARAFVDALNAGARGDSSAGLRVFQGRPRANLIQSYGEDFTLALEASPIGKWQALATRDGWRAVRLDATVPAKAADYEALRGVVLQDWTDATMAAQRTAAVRVLAKKYLVKYESPAP